MKCALCGYLFDEKNTEASCKGCLMAGGCNLIRCPNCGYETPREPKWLKKIFKSSLNGEAGRSKNGTDRKS